jgi:hypothetical protein
MLTKLPRWLEGLVLGAIILLVVGLALFWAQVGTTDSGKSCASVALWAWVDARWPPTKILPVD